MSFLLYSDWWQGCVCNIREKQSDADFTYGKMYLITREQVLDVFKQENSIAVQEKAEIDWSRLMSDLHLQVNSGAYGKLLVVGFDEKKIPILSFSHPDAVYD